MNPASISTRLTTLFAVAATCSNKLRNIIDASKYSSVPSEILALSNEINDFRAVLAEVEANHQVMSRPFIITGQAEYTDTRTADQLERAHSKMKELDRLISSSIKLKQQSPKQIFRKAAWLRNKNESMAIIQDLKEVKQNIMLIMASRAA